MIATQLTVKSQKVQCWTRFCIFVELLAIAASPLPTSAASSLITDAEMRVIMSKVVTPSNITRITYGLDQGGAASVTLWYGSLPAKGVAEIQTRFVARQLVAALVAAGHDPDREMTGVFVWAEEGGLVTASGEPGVLLLGHTHYNWGTGRLDWDAENLDR
jgi:hypothetical protein